ncbi:MAG: hypothetical protein IPG33_04505 [Betaproteobacteria bacterium]|nr:hypothetical protein [Betaproteobacteria bacterium]
MGILGSLFGAKSKYDKSLPYTYEARIRIFEDGTEHKSYISDTICGLIEHLHRNGIGPGKTEIYEIYQARETPIDAGLFTTADQQWLFKPDICRAFEQHYAGHIQETSCSFKDRGRGCLGP